MYKLIDFEYRDFYDPHSIDVENYYKVRNIETNEEKWVDEDTYYNYERLGLLQEK